MRGYYDLIYLSPHLDDVALSCGGQIVQQRMNGRSVLIVTIAAGNPPATLSALARKLHEHWELPSEVITIRRDEDRLACHLLDTDYLHWDIPDAIYRLHPLDQTPLYPVMEMILEPVLPVDYGLIVSLVKQLQTLPGHQQVVAPLAVGNHVDHQITRLAAEYCFGSALLYYEDYPYAHLPGALEKAIRPPDGWQSETIHLSEQALTNKLQAVASFQSQLKSLAGSRLTMEQMIMDYTTSVGGERTWQRKQG
jgi:LmbE family N-acetylglucosaminyl deacetylase